MNLNKKINLSLKLAEHVQTLKNFLKQIKEIEDDTISSVNNKFSKIKKIQEEISKVGVQIDIIKKEITLTNSYNIN